MKCIQLTKIERAPFFYCLLIRLRFTMIENSILLFTKSFNTNNSLFTFYRYASQILGKYQI